MSIHPIVFLQSHPYKKNIIIIWQEVIGPSSVTKSLDSETSSRDNELIKEFRKEFKNEKNYSKFY